MIAKELETLTVTDKRRTAGHAAETQLAFYLQRTFADTPDIHVFNSLRFEFDADAAQVDHLVLYPYGLIVIESKSVHAKLNDYALKVYRFEHGLKVLDLFLKDKCFALSIRRVTVMFEVLLDNLFGDVAGTLRSITDFPGMPPPVAFL